MNELDQAWQEYYETILGKNIRPALDTKFAMGFKAGLKYEQDRDNGSADNLKKLELALKAHEENIADLAIADFVAQLSLNAGAKTPSIAVCKRAIIECLRSYKRSKDILEEIKKCTRALQSPQNT